MAHQLDGIDFLTERHAGLLAFEQGLGKTLVAIQAFRGLLDRGEAERMLVVCPNSLKRNWTSEIEKFAPGLSTAVAEGPPRVRRAVFAETTATVVVTSYETARTELTALRALAGRSRVVLVLDESHMAKNRHSLTSTAMRQLAPACEYRWLLSGTPVTNSPADLHTQIGLVAPFEQPLGSLESFLARVETDPAATFAKPTLERLVIRRTKEQCLDLPAKTFTDVVVELPPWQRRLYDEMRSSMVCEIQGMSGEQYTAFAATALARLTRLAQLASNPALLISEAAQTPAKFEVLDGLLADIMSVPGRKVIIWSNYVRNIESLVARFAEYGSCAIYGAIAAEDRQDVASRFQTDPDMRILVANAAAAGTGFTLTAANCTIYESMSWRYDHYAQSQDRNHRIGQTQSVAYLRLIAGDTIDEAVVNALRRKTGMAAGLLSDTATSRLFSRLTPAEMCRLISANVLPD